ncbi:MAG: tRNA (adenosine(37)-N6)-threonylcarbamoyltransferase complex ATPase subunit type 1 TsaE [Sulfurimonadaceae bacterium]|jgi:tRNA threonylcarbamoyladenosine biosynthesis protein TsaE|nr:tRNA (adenosine(37)-N6)-threonylcarbamoyltransferase complex ATPase subunit type 1 TsaE [Sulfurimonadaceae bacterium]
MRVAKLDELDTIAKEILNNIKNGVLILRGDLASGKTTLTKAIVKELGLVDEVTSPTFSLQNNYSDRVFHYDIYNKEIEHFISLGMLEELEKEALHIVEWGDDRLIEILKKVGIEFMVVDIKKIANDKREYRLCTH